MNPTAEKFGYPGSLVKEFEHWLVLVRPTQPTLGSLVLVCKDPVTSFGDISPAAATELQTAAATIEHVLKEIFGWQRINYLMLMMVDPDVHFHVLPRYGRDLEYRGLTFRDASWPGPPDVTAANEFPEACRKALVDDLRTRLRGHTRPPEHS